MTRCEGCQNFRRTRLLSSLLETEIRGRNPEVLQALTKVADSEGKAREGEIQVRLNLIKMDRLDWGMRPFSSDCCGEHEAKEVFEIHQLKDKREDCQGFTAGPPPKVSCDTCVHARAAKGIEEGNIVAQVAGEGIAMNAGGGWGAVNPGLYGGILAGLGPTEGSAMALEIEQAWASRGRLARRPKYLRECASYSEDGMHAVCVIYNQFGTCPRHEPLHPNRAASDPSAPAARAISSPEASTGTDARVKPAETPSHKGGWRGLLESLLEEPKSAEEPLVGGHEGPGVATELQINSSTAGGWRSLLRSVLEASQSAGDAPSERQESPTEHIREQQKWAPTAELGDEKVAKTALAINEQEEQSNEVFLILEGKPYYHPERAGFHIQPLQGYLFVHNPEGENFNVGLWDFPRDEWRSLRDGRGEEMPLIVFYKGLKLYGQWR